MKTQCALCRTGTPLCDSHIIPEFAYTPLYDDKHRMIAFTPEDISQRYFEQKGLRSRLLCKACECYLSREYEAPMKEFWIDNNPLVGLKGGSNRVIEGIDYTRFKLFHLSVIWRAGMSSHPAFWQVNLGPHEESMRAMLLRREAGPSWQYPIFCEAVTDGSAHCDNLVISPRHFKLFGHRGYQFTYLSCQWYYIVSSHRDSRWEKMCLQSNGKLLIGNRELTAVFRSVREGWVA